MKQFVTSNVCLSCDGCCQFHNEKDEWRAKAGKLEEKVIMQNLPEEYQLSGKSVVEDGGYLVDKKCHGMFVCTFFNSQDHTCSIYEKRPLECQIYPFVLTSTEGRRTLSVHLACPVVQEKKDSDEYRTHVQYLKDEFKKENISKLLDENPHLFGKYEKSLNELEVVFDID